MRWPDDVDPASLRQPDRLSCGAASVVAARVLLSSWRPDDAAAEIRAEHRALTSTQSPRGRFQWPWPRRLGTPPWAVANALRALTGRPIATVHVRPRADIGHEVLLAQLADRPVGVYLGNRWLPRHVVLALRAVPGGGVEVFDPAAGALITVDAAQWRRHRVGVAGWSHTWFLV